MLWDEAAPIERLRGTRRTLVRVLEAILRLAHPFMPFITEEIWQSIKGLAGKVGPTIMLQAYPVAEQHKIDKQAEADIEWLKAFINGIRNIRAEMAINPGKPLAVLLNNVNSEDQRRLQQNLTALLKLAKLSSISLLAKGEEAPAAATTLVGEMEVLVAMAGLIDKTAELARLDKEIQKITADITRTKGKLSNANFVDKAPAEVIAKERAKLTEAEQAVSKLREQQHKIANL